MSMFSVDEHLYYAKSTAWFPFPDFKSQCVVCICDLYSQVLSYVFLIFLFSLRMSRFLRFFFAVKTYTEYLVPVKFYT